jgi:hypothetical protein
MFDRIDNTQQHVFANILDQLLRRQTTVGIRLFGGIDFAGKRSIVAR